MFHVHGVHGRMFSGTLEQLQQQPLVSGVARLRRTAPLLAEADPPLPAATGSGGGGRPLGQAAVQAYGQGQAARARQPLRCAADVMHSPALTVPDTATLREAWLTLDRHGIGQAPVVGAGGALVGLVARAQLMPAAGLEPQGAAAESARLSQPVTAVMWSPVPGAAPDTDLRRVAALLLHTGLPGVPVVADSQALLGFVSRTDLLRALATDPPLDIWG